MQRLLTGLVALALVISPAMAEANSGGTEAEKAAATANAAKPENSAKSDSAAKPESPSMEFQMGQLRSLLEAQAEELKAQHAALLEQQNKMAALEEQLRAAREVNGVSSEAGAAVLAPAADSTASLAAATPMTAAQENKKEEPITAIRYKGVTITPGGFLAAETVWRSRALSADINTPFNNVPFPGASQSKVSEFNLSGRPSRITLLVEGKAQSAKFTGYFETDWQSAGVTSNNNQSNSYTLRQRQIWGQAALDSGWMFTGGQMWSLVTERRKAIDNRTEAVPLTIDHQYTVGFSWARQFGFRVTKNVGDKVWLAFAVEGSQTTFGGRGFSTFTDAKNNVNSNFFIATPGAGGGLFNATANYTFNKTPDFVVKAAFEPGWGHYEIFGVVSTFRSRIFPCAVASVAVPCAVNGAAAPTAIGATNDSRTGGGFGVNLRAPIIANKLEAGIHFMAGDGIGRYGTVGLADATARPDGTLAPIRGVQALGTLEWHPTPKLDLYANFGGEYNARASYLGYSTTTTDPITALQTTKLNQPGGYGNPLFNNTGCGSEVSPTNQNTPGAGGKCAGDSRVVFEGTLGYWYRFYKGDRGALQVGMQYSYISRSAWSGNNGVATGPGISPKGTENMVMTSFRYYLP